MFDDLDVSSISSRDKSSLWTVFFLLLLCLARNKYISFTGADPLVTIQHQFP